MYYKIIDSETPYDQFRKVRNAACIKLGAALYPHAGRLQDTTAPMARYESYPLSRFSTSRRKPHRKRNHQVPRLVRRFSSPTVPNLEPIAPNELLGAFCIMHYNLGPLLVEKAFLQPLGAPLVHRQARICATTRLWGPNIGVRIGCETPWFVEARDLVLLRGRQPLVPGDEYVLLGFCFSGRLRVGPGLCFGSGFRLRLGFRLWL